MKIWFWLLLSLIMLIVSCASGYYEKKSGYHEENSVYWNEILYHRTSEPEQR